MPFSEIIADKISPLQEIVLKDILTNYLDVCQSAYDETVHKNYCRLQATWNYKVLLDSLPHVLNEESANQRVLSLGSFLGLSEIALAKVFSEVICVDHENHLIKTNLTNLIFHKADLDSAFWTLPEGNFKICYMIELLEHLLWSPIAILKALSKKVDYLAITTPDDEEWPEMPARSYIRHQHFSAIPGAFPGCNGNPEPMNHCKQYSQSEFVELLTVCGFRVLSLTRVGKGAHQMLAICEPRR